MQPVRTSGSVVRPACVGMDSPLVFSNVLLSFEEVTENVEPAIAPGAARPLEAHRIANPAMD